MVDPSPVPDERAGHDHANRTVAGMKPKTTRKRAAVACDECRVRKRRCDGAVPACGACRKRMRICQYAADAELAGWRERMIKSLRNQLDELERPETPQSQTTGQPPESHELTSGSVQDFHNQVLSPGNPEDVDGIAVQDTIDVARQVGHSDTGLSPTAEDSPLRKEQDYTAPRIPGGTVRSDLECTSPEDDRASFNLESMMKPIINHLVDDSATPYKQTFGVHLATDQAISVDQERRTSGMTQCRCDSLLQAQQQWRLPLRRIADSLITRYFSRHNIAFPVLHEQTFRQQYNKLWELSPTGCCGLCKQRSRGKLLLPTVYAVFAYASLMETNQPRQNVARAKSFFQMTQEVDLLQILDHEVGIELIQLLLLMGKYLQSTEQLSKYKNISGLTIRMAQNMGLQYNVREAQRRGLLSDPATQLECELRARLWYGCVLIERDIPLYLSIDRSIGSSIKDINPPLPLAIDDNQLSDEVGKTGMQPEGLPSTMEIFIAIIKLHEILTQALGWNNCSSETSSDSSIAVRSMLKSDNLMREWRDGLPEHLHFDSSLDESQVDMATSIETQGAQAQPTNFVQATARKIHIRNVLSRSHTCPVLTVRRYLHACQIILRPALELFFNKAQRQRTSLKRRRLHDDLEDVMFTAMASKCIVSAMTIIGLLGAESKPSIFVAWWLNIAYLHTCGSTILMARMCTFNDAKFDKKSLLSSWNLCLKTLERYAGLSGIARRSSYLLRKSAERLLFTGQSQITDPGVSTSDSNSRISKRQQQDDRDLESWFSTTGGRPKTQDGMAQGGQHSPRFTPNLSWNNNNDSFESSEDWAGMISLLDSNLDSGLLPGLDDNFWAGSLDLPSWSTMPSNEQLGASTPRFDF